MKTKKSKILLTVISLLILSAPNLNAQVLSGASFLRSLPGARLQAMSGSSTAGLDVIHAHYANPGIAGFMREWQWSAGYTKWIADVYNASFIYGRRIRMPWSSQSRFALGVLYQGVDEFDSSDGATPMASANDVLFTAGYGQPLSFISNWISLGGQFKYFKSTLAHFDASSMMGDFGLFLRTPNFNMPLNGLGLFEYGILSTGVSMVNVGSDLEFISVSTPLPRAFRGGVAINAGTHDGFQTQFAVDYIKYDDEDSAVNFGLEFSWNRLLAISTGYQKDIGLMDQATFGLSLNLDDLRMPKGSPLPGRNNALRLDVASMDEGEFFSRTYRGGVSHYIIGPESFEFDYPIQHETVNQDSLTLLWEKSKDPDLYDAVNYHLLVSQDSSLIAGVLAQLKYDEISSSSIASKDGILVSERTTAYSHKLQNLAGGDYYWSVIAYDKNDHYKLAKRDGAEISHFYIPLPDLIVEKIEFEYYPWITTDEYQGKLSIQLRNAGQVAANNVSIFFHDSVTVPINNPADHESWAHTAFLQMDRIGPGEADTLVLDWHRVTMGLCRILVAADLENTIPELDETNNEHVEYFYTIPKGTFTTGDVTSILAFQKAITEIPMINEVNFDMNSAIVPELYMAHEDFVPPVSIIAERMKKNGHIKISLQGFSDTNSETATTKLANDRAQAVKDKLLSLNVSDNQIVMKEGKVLAKRRVPVKAEDARWVFEERRKVEIQIIHDPDNLLYEPVPEIDEGHFAYPLSFDSKIRAAIPAELWGVHLGTDANYFNYDLESMDLTSQVGVQWTTRDSADFVKLLDKEVEYAITLTDTLHRTFRTKPQNTMLAQDEMTGEHRFSFPLKFDDTDLLYHDYWQRIFDYGEKYFSDPSVRLRFDGHACAIGRAAYNLKLSERRAATLKQNYENYLGQKQASASQNIKSKLKKSVDGYGEENAFEIVKVQKPNKVIGDNELPIGRKYNRRIEIIYYVPDSEQK